MEKKLTSDEILEMMEKYNLTLKRIGESQTSYTHIPYGDYKLKENECIVETAVKEMSEEDYEKNKQYNCFARNTRWNNGYIIQKWIKATRKRQYTGWLVEDEHRNKWYGDTPSDAVSKAVEDIEKKLKERNDMQRAAGL